MKNKLISTNNLSEADMQLRLSRLEYALSSKSSIKR